MFEKIEGTENVYARRIKLSWVKDLLNGKIKDAGMAPAMFKLVFQVICDKDGKALKEDDLFLDDLTAIQAYIMDKISLKKKVKPDR